MDVVGGIQALGPMGSLRAAIKSSTWASPRDARDSGLVCSLGIQTKAPSGRLEMPLPTLCEPQVTCVLDLRGTLSCPLLCDTCHCCTDKNVQAGTGASLALPPMALPVSGDARPGTLPTRPGSPISRPPRALPVTQAESIFDVPRRRKQSKE